MTRSPWPTDVPCIGQGLTHKCRLGPIVLQNCDSHNSRIGTCLAPDPRTITCACRRVRAVRAGTLVSQMYVKDWQQRLPLLATGPSYLLVTSLHA